MDRRTDRKTFLRSLARAAARPFAPFRARRPAAPALWLRPPGARVESEFLARCRPGCRLCRDACPFAALGPAPPAAGPGRGTPRLDPSRTACYLCADLPCARSCPTGALEPCPPEAVRVGWAVVDQAACRRFSRGRCNLCVAVCPFPGAAIVEDPLGRPMVAREACAGCGLCVRVCPADPPAISVHPRSEDRLLE